MKPDLPTPLKKTVPLQSRTACAEVKNARACDEDNSCVTKDEERVRRVRVTLAGPDFFFSCFDFGACLKNRSRLEWLISCVDSVALFVRGAVTHLAELPERLIVELLEEVSEIPGRDGDDRKKVKDECVVGSL